jgi:hypothetical protein
MLSQKMLVAAVTHNRGSLPLWVRYIRHQRSYAACVAACREAVLSLCQCPEYGGFRVEMLGGFA